MNAKQRLQRIRTLREMDPERLVELLADTEQRLEDANRKIDRLRGEMSRMNPPEGARPDLFVVSKWRNRIAVALDQLYELATKIQEPEERIRIGNMATDAKTDLEKIREAVPVKRPAPAPAVRQARQAALWDREA